MWHGSAVRFRLVHLIIVDGTGMLAQGRGGHPRLDFMARLAAVIPTPRVKRTGTPSPDTTASSPARRGPNHRCSGEVTPARRGKGVKRISNDGVRSPGESHTARDCPALPGMTRAQGLKRVFSIDVEVCSRCGGSAKVIWDRVSFRSRPFMCPVPQRRPSATISPHFIWLIGYIWAFI